MPPGWYRAAGPAVGPLPNAYPPPPGHGPSFLQHLRGRILYDTGFFNHHPYNLTMPPYDDAAALRSARIGVEGIVWDLMRYRAEVDFANGDGLGNNFQDTNSALAANVNRIVEIKDMFIEMSKLPIIGCFRAGYFKEPFSLEQQTAEVFLTFMERSPMDRGRPVVFDDIVARNTDLVPGRNTGVMVRNSWFEDRLWAAAGWFRADSDARGFDSGDGDYALTTRITALPLWEQDGRYMVHVGGAYSLREYREPAGLGSGGGNLPVYTSRLATLGTPLLLNTGVLENINRGDYVGVEFATVLGPLSLQAEYVGVSLHQVKGKPPLSYWGAYGYVSYFLTGEHRRYNKFVAAFDRVIPKQNFFCLDNPHACLDGKRFITGTGAWEVAIRYGVVDLSSLAQREIDGMLPPDDPGYADQSLEGGSGVLHEVTVGLNWYWNPNARMMLNYVRTQRESDSSIDANGLVSAVLIRMQIDW
jgi:phosphate-selective porin OprO/OprP